MQHKRRLSTWLFGKLAARWASPLFLVLFTHQTSAQTTTAHINHTKKLLDSCAAFLRQVQAVCKTDECSALVSQGDQILNDAQTKIKNRRLDARKG